MLEQLEAANLFLIPLDEERRWYRYHHLFAEVLRARLLPMGPEPAAALHERAATWHETEGRIEEALTHALAGGQAERAARLREQQSGSLAAWRGEHGHGQPRHRGPAGGLLQPAPSPAKREGYMRAVVHAGGALAPAPSDSAARGIAPGPLGQALAALPARRPGPLNGGGGAPPPLVEPLSEREMEVLRLAAVGLSNGAMAAQLYISPGTVKRHLHNINGKLAVTNRLSAVARAQELRLL
jgi:ATP/maltotriose-dependent transcriptional regulator MalT